MILTTLELENYKQFGGAHRIDFPEQGMVSVTGPNGAGKTTLFEAIEWCLYGPRTVELTSIPPHGGAGRTTVRVTLQDPSDDRRYVVQRELRLSGTRAEVYCEDEPERPLVQGPRDVTAFVAKQLIGLPHGAFVSTFFTRQKELTFFGDRKPTDRRVEVARLLGFQTIRNAQEEIAEERNAARAAARSLREQYEGGSEGRDFEAEIARANAVVSSATAEEAENQSRMVVAEEANTRARLELEHWRELQERDADCERELLTIGGASQAAASRRDAAEAELRRLEALAAERITLAGEADRVKHLLATVATHEAERDRDRHLASLRQSLQTHEGQLAATSATLEKIVVEHAEAAAGLDGWFWRDADRDDPCATVSRLLMSVSLVNHRGSQERAELLQRATEVASSLDAIQAKLERFRTFRQGLIEERDNLIGGVDPAEQLSHAENTARAAQDELERAIAALSAAQQERQASEELERIFDERSFDRRCPTCTRTLTADEAAQLVKTLRGASELLRRQEAAHKEASEVARKRVDAAELSRARAMELVQKVATLDERLGDGNRMIEGLELDHAQGREALRSALSAAALAEPPRAEDLVRAKIEAEQAHRMHALTGTLDQLGLRATAAQDGTRETRLAIEEMGEVLYERAAHVEATSALESARHAAAEIKRVDMELRARPDYELTRDSATRELAELAARRQTAEAARADLGFDADLLRAARAAEMTTGAEQHVARDGLAVARETRRDAELALRRTVDERDRLQQLAEEADRRGRDADELERMYREFAEFDKYVADHVGPLLAETTERLLGQVTDGKYDHVRFDENYGIEVFDGDESFKLEGFSGGERDVVALCARLAMSELVGSAALRPPRFLVLDEVFGSLDSERRTQLLGTLGSLSSSGHFQQVFIISHVDDVQQSHVMDEAWTVAEQDGVSRVVRPALVAGTGK